MQPLAINFVAAPRLGSAAGWLLLAVGAAARAAVALDALDAREALARAEAQRARLERQLRQPAPTGPGAGPAREAAARAVARLRLPWDALLREIERLADDSVALLSVEAQGQARSLRLAGEAKTMADAVAYLARLRESSLIEAAHLAGHEERQAGGVKVVRFTIEAGWSGAP